MKKLNSCVFVVAMALMACGQREATPSNAALEVAAKYCAKDFKPYDAIVDACNAEGRQGKSGAACATFNQVDAILGQRHVASGFKECNSPELHWGPNANKK